MNEKPKRITPEDLREIVEERISQNQSEYIKKADALYLRVMGRLSKGKYRITSKGIIEFKLWLWSDHDTRSIDLLNAQLKLEGYWLHRPSWGGDFGDYLDFEISIIDSEHPSSYRPKPSISDLLESSKRG